MTEEIIKYVQVEKSELMDIVTERDRLKQENEALRNGCNKCKQYEIEKFNRKLLDENEELKKKLENEEYNACCECTNIQNQNDNYRSALEEIENIILTYKSKEWNCFNDMDIKLEQISKVINEVL